MGRMPQDVQKPRTDSSDEESGLGLHTKQPTERGIASQFGQTAVIRGMPQQGGARRRPGGRRPDSRPFHAPALRSPCSREASGIASRQRRTVSKEGDPRALPKQTEARGCHPHSRDVSSTRALVYVAIDTPCKGAWGKIVIFMALRCKVMENTRKRRVPRVRAFRDPLAAPRTKDLRTAHAARLPPLLSVLPSPMRYDRLTKCSPKRIQRGIHMLLNANIPD